MTSSSPTFPSVVLLRGVVGIDDRGPFNTLNRQLVNGIDGLSAVRLLYPHDGTFYPRGIPPNFRTVALGDP